MDAANMIAGEKVYIADNNNGERFETYIIKGGARFGQNLFERARQPVGFNRMTLLLSCRMH